MLASVVFYAQTGSSWLLFAGLLFSPDMFMLGYLVNPQLGAQLYNVGHSYLIPALLLALSVLLVAPLLTAVGFIWTAHIGLDRALGYGLKRASGFKHTHLS